MRFTAACTLLFVLQSLVLTPTFGAVEADFFDSIKSSEIVFAGDRDDKPLLDLANPQPVVLFFLSKDCPCATSHLEHLSNLSRIFKDLSFIGVSVDRSLEVEDLRAFYLSRVSFTVIDDRNHHLARRLEALTTPHAFVFDSIGEIIYSGAVTGSATFDEERSSRRHLQEALTRLKEGEAPNRTRTRPLGCAIPYSRGES